MSWFDQPPWLYSANCLNRRIVDSSYAMIHSILLYWSHRVIHTSIKWPDPPSWFIQLICVYLVSIIRLHVLNFPHVVAQYQIMDDFRHLFHSKVLYSSDSVGSIVLSGLFRRTVSILVLVFYLSIEFQSSYMYVSSGHDSIGYTVFTYENDAIIDYVLIISGWFIRSVWFTQSY